MEEEGKILCFQHCKAGAFICCLALPSHCPICNSALVSTTLRIPPFKFPSPFISNTDEHPFSLLLKPTHGTFLQDYKNASDLHIGITDSKGRVFDYDSSGLKRFVQEGWSQSIVVYQLSEDEGERMGEVWDTRLRDHCSVDFWTSERYSEKAQNCYDFVISFLQRLDLPLVKRGAENKSEFCREFVVPHTTRAAKYISLYRRLQREGTVVQTDTAL